MIYSVHQPHYIPYPGYLAKVAASDQFVFLENVQYVRREFQNRNKVKGQNGAQWLTVPVKGEYGSAISTMTVDYGAGWQKKHIETLRRFYSKAEFTTFVDDFAGVIEIEYESLGDLLMATTRFFIETFGISTPVKTQSELEPLPDTPNERIFEIGKKLGASSYLAGAGGKNYMDTELFTSNGIEVAFQDYHATPYPQLHGDFVPHLGSIDLLLTNGPGGFRKYVLDSE